MDRNELRQQIRQFFKDNGSVINEHQAIRLLDYLKSLYPKERYGNNFRIECKYDDLFNIISGKIGKYDILEEDFALESIDFSINENLEITAYTKEPIVLNLDIDNLSQDDLVDIKSIKSLRFDLLRTFLRTKKENRGKLAAMIDNCLGYLGEDIPSYSFYKYTGKFLRKDKLNNYGGFMAFSTVLGDSLIIENTIHSIGEHAFEKCENLKQVYINSKNLHYVGFHAFAGIDGLEINISQDIDTSLWDSEWHDSNCVVKII